MNGINKEQNALKLRHLGLPGLFQTKCKLPQLVYTKSGVDGEQGVGGGGEALLMKNIVSLHSSKQVPALFSKTENKTCKSLKS